MKINASSVIAHPRARVFAAYRDELPQVAPYMHNVKEIVVRSRTPREGGVKLHNEWVGKGEIPKVAQGVVKPEMLRWDDFADWDDATTSCNWELKIRLFAEKFHCSGRTVLADEGAGRTRVTLTGTLELDMRDIPGVPRFLAGTVAPQVEKFVIALVTPNLEQVNASLQKYLDAKG